MSLDDPVIITNSISGAIANRDQCPAIPYTPEEYGEEARRAAEEGAVMIHIHARRPDGTPSLRDRGLPGHHRGHPGRGGRRDHQLLHRRARRPAGKRIAYLAALKPEVGALNMGSMNYAKYSRRRKDFVFQAVFENSFETITTLVGAMNEHGIKPEHECFDSGHLANLDPLLDMGLLEPAAAGLLRHGRDRRHPPDRAQPRPHGRAGPARRPRVGRDRHLARPVDARGRGAQLSAATSASASRTTSTCPTARWPRSNGDLVGPGARGWSRTSAAAPATVDEARQMLGLRGAKVTRRDLLEGATP